eukprot:CAMPEP_0170553348 /NCGR_PEP_ID=MMETSP0211-20121228/11165_1 /TAXON_ID=311385 /ORGANISM="Pseudokeronopsis sp., Strain OXSARD2" /LENGTH=34 /DNA_ID= /DNA_START= /DNA_END= /DNA_ORIENTATION=
MAGFKIIYFQSLPEKGSPSLNDFKQNTNKPSSLT